MARRKLGDRPKRTSKIGRNKSWCQAYRAACRQEINQKRRLRRHIRRHPADMEARKALDRVARGE